MQSIYPNVIYRVARRDNTTQQSIIYDDFYDLKTVQSVVKRLDAESEEHLDYYIDAVRLDRLPRETLLDLLNKKLITQLQFEQAMSQRRTH